MVSNHFREQEQKEMRAEKEEAIKLKKIASQMAKMVKEFWTNIEKVLFLCKFQGSHRAWKTGKIIMKTGNFFSLPPNFVSFGIDISLA